MFHGFVAQWIRARVSEARSRGFKPLLAHQLQVFIFYNIKHIIKSTKKERWRINSLTIKKQAFNKKKTTKEHISL